MKQFPTWIKHKFNFLLGQKYFCKHKKHLDDESMMEQQHVCDGQ